MDLREESLAWWHSLPLAEQEQLAKAFKPEWPFAMVAKSSSTIERIFWHTQLERKQ